MENINKKKFPQEYQNLPTDSRPGDLFTSRIGDGKGFKMSLRRLSEELQIDPSVPKALAPTDPAPTLSGVYYPTVTQNEAGTPIVYANAGGIEVNTAEGGEDHNSMVQLIYDGSSWSKVRIPIEVPPAIEVVDDLTEGGANKALSAEQGKILDNQEFFGLVNSVNTINFTDTEAVKKIILTAATPLVYKGVRYTMPPQTVEFPSTGSHFLIKYDKQTEEIAVVEQSTSSNEQGKITIGTVVYLSGVFYISGINQDAFQINGLKYFDYFGLSTAKDIFYVNNSYNQITGGITQFETKALAREATAMKFRKRGLVITYKLTSESHWRIEQYVGSTNPTWAYTDNAFIDLTKKTVNASYVTTGSNFVSFSAQKLSIPAGALSTDDGRRINVSAQVLDVPTGYSRLVSNIGGVLSIQGIDVALKFDLGNEQINIATLYLEAITSNIKVAGDILPLNGYAQRNYDERLVTLNNSDADVNFNLYDRLIEFKGGAFIDPEQPVLGRVNFPLVNVPIPQAITNGVVLFNRGNNTIVVRNQASAPLKNHYILFTYRYLGAYNTFWCSNIQNYSVNGTPYGRKDIRQIYPYSMDQFGVSYKNMTEQDGVGSADTFNVNTLTSTMLYSMYDSVVSGITQVTKTLVGTTDTGLPVNKYKINFMDSESGTRNKPKIMLVGGVHGGERLAVYTLYLFVKNLIENPDKNEMIEVLKRNFEWVIMPLANPFALDAGPSASVRWNHNGVDINRNFDFKWTEYNDGGFGASTYKGTAPFSEKESQFVRDTVIAEKDRLILYFDCHNYSSSSMTNKATVWMAVSSLMIHNFASVLCDRFNFEFKKRYDYFPDNEVLAYTTKNFGEPMGHNWTSYHHQIPSLTIETDMEDFFQTGGYSYDADCITRSLETYVNSFYSFAKSTIEIYNNR